MSTTVETLRPGKYHPKLFFVADEITSLSLGPRILILMPLEKLSAAVLGGMKMFALAWDTYGEDEGCVWEFAGEYSKANWKLAAALELLAGHGYIRQL